MLTSTSTAHMTKTDLNFVRFYIPTSGITHKNTRVINVFFNHKKANAVSTAAIYEPLTHQPTLISSTETDLSMETAPTSETDPTRRALEPNVTDYKTVHSIISDVKALPLTAMAWSATKSTAAETNFRVLQRDNLWNISTTSLSHSTTYACRFSLRVYYYLLLYPEQLINGNSGRATD